MCYAQCKMNNVECRIKEETPYGISKFNLAFIILIVI